jgi:tectonic-1/3
MVAAVWIAVSFATVAVALTVENAIDFTAISVTQEGRVNTATNEFGSCICDRSPQCDPNCCCDPDCTQQVISEVFTGCAKAVAGKNEIVRCSDPDTSAATDIVFHRDEYKEQKPVAKAAVCIVRTNLPDDMTEYFRLPTSTDGAAPVSPVWPARDALVTGNSFAFKAGDRLPYVKATLTGAAWTVALEGSGYLTDPRPTGAGGRCQTDRLTGFLDPHRLQECAWTGGLASLCANELNADVRKHYIALTPPEHLLTSASRVIPVRLVVQVASSGTVLQDLAPADNPLTTLLNPGTGRRQSSSGESSFNPATGICSNAILRRELNIVYSAESGGAIITAATMTFYVGDVVNNTASVYWTAYRTTFQREGEAARDVVPQRVGNPGYVAGSPVLAGRLVTDPAGTGKEAIAARTAGFTLPFGRLCSDHQQIGVRFLHDVKETACGVNLTEADLNNLCFTQTTTDVLIKDALTPVGEGNISYLIDRIGFTANAQYSHVNDWVPVKDVPWTASAATWSSTQRSCTGLTVGVRWIISVARGGIAYNPQDVIVGARAVPIVGTWRFRSARTWSLFPLRFEVAFVRLGEEGDVSRKAIVPPNILPPVDEDVFFPFRRAGDRTEDVD